MINIEFTQEEIQALVGLMDSGIKQIGLSGAIAAAVILQKIDAAQKAEEECLPSD